MKRGRKPIANREDVRSLHVTIKLSVRERAMLGALLALRAGDGARISPGAFFRELLMKDLRRFKG